MGGQTRRSNVAIVFFDIETGGFRRTDDILQISAKCKNSVFDRYATPTKSISPEATCVHGLTKIRSTLYLDGIRLSTSPLKSVLIELLHFLRGLGGSCVLVAHNCGFDSSRLLLKIEKFSLTDEFEQVVVGFVDSLDLFRDRFPDRGGKGAFRLTSLAKELLNLSHEEVHANAHNALHDVQLLERLVLKFISRNEIVQNVKSFESQVQAMHDKEDMLYYRQSLKPLANVVSKSMLERMAYATIHYNTVLNEYHRGDQHLINLLERRVNGRPQVIKSRRVINDILNYFRELFDDY